MLFRSPQYNNQQKDERPRRQFTRLGMTLSQILPQLLKTNLVVLKEAPKNPNTTSPKYNPNARCAFHSDSPGYNTDDCWVLRNKIHDLIDAKEIEFGAPEKPKQDAGVNVIGDDNDEEFDINSWIYPTADGGLSNWTSKDSMSVSVITQ